MDDPLEREWMKHMIRNQNAKLNNLSQLQDKIKDLESTCKSLKEKKSNFTDLNLKNDLFYKETVEPAQETAQQTKEILMTVSDEQWSQMIEIDPYPSMQLMVSMSAILTLLGHEVDSKSWKSIKSVLVAENADIKSKMIEFDARKITPERRVMAESFDGYERYANLSEMDVDDNGGDAMAQLTSILIRWVTAHIKYATVYQQYEEKKIANVKDLDQQIEFIEFQKRDIEKSKAKRDIASCRIEEVRSILKQVETTLDDDMKQQEEEKQSEEKKIVPSEMKHRRSIKNYIFIQSENDIVAIHPVNPTFDLLNVGQTRYGTSFCNSRQYGTFYITHKGLAIAQSPKYDANDVHLVYRSGAPHKRWNQCFSMDSCDDFKADEIQKCMLSLIVFLFQDNLKSHIFDLSFVHTLSTQSIR